VYALHANCVWAWLHAVRSSGHWTTRQRPCLEARREQQQQQQPKWLLHRPHLHPHALTRPPRDSAISRRFKIAKVSGLRCVARHGTRQIRVFSRINSLKGSEMKLVRKASSLGNAKASETELGARSLNHSSSARSSLASDLTPRADTNDDRTRIGPLDAHFCSAPPPAERHGGNNCAGHRRRRRRPRRRARRERTQPPRALRRHHLLLKHVQLGLGWRMR
jgi:hypothetical protein